MIVLTGEVCDAIVSVVGRAPPRICPLSVRTQPAPQRMYILYLDESGTSSEARYFVVAGFAAFERETYFLSQSLDQLQAKYLPDFTDQAYLHASSLRAPKGRIPAPFDSLTDEDRKNLINEIYEVIAVSRVRVFAVAMEKASLSGDPYERGFEEIINRFDRMLARELRDRGEPQRGLVILAESSYRENLERLARNIWSRGHRWGEIHNQADVPYFAPAQRTRLLQLADFIANAVFGNYESGYGRGFQTIAPRIDQQDGHLHGLVHITRDRQSCYCPACVARRSQPTMIPSLPIVDDRE